MKDELSRTDEWAVKWLARESGVPEEEMRKRIMSLPVDEQEVRE